MKLKLKDELYFITSKNESETLLSRAKNEVNYKWMNEYVDNITYIMYIMNEYEQWTNVANV